MRWFMRATRPSPRALQLRVAERLYRPEDVSRTERPHRPRRGAQAHVGVVLERLRDRALGLAQGPPEASGAEASGRPSASTMNS